ncbi:MAG TPA: PIN domain-containing protein [Gemmataceae bacterium]|jgi:predicted nucleic acid-binding protein|nr:PIN domain-containing protein [Gemmataceae bacterium]
MLLDTSGLLCCLDASDFRHQDAVTFFEAANVRLTHNYILVEFVALAAARRLPRNIALLFAETLLSNPDIDLTWVDRPLHEAAMTLLREQPDKNYSLCDAVSFLLMRTRGIQDALTTDHHFEQAGFRRLLMP